MANKAQLQTNNIVLDGYITKIYELKEMTSALPDMLPILTNAGVAADLALGKQLIDGNGNVITGTHECDSGDSVTPAPTWDGTLYDAGDEYTDYTGGWTGVAAGDSSYGLSGRAPTITKNTSSMTIRQSSSQSSGVARTSNQIDLTNYSTLTVNVSAFNSNGSYNGAILRVYNSSMSAVASTNITSTGSKSVSVSSLNGSYYIGIYLYNYDNTPSITITNAKLS